MRRRSFIRKAGTVALTLSGGADVFAGISFQRGPALSIVLRGGRCFYQNRWQSPDVGIDQAGKLFFGAAGQLVAPQIISIENRIISPGFIDILADNATNPQRTYKIFEKYKVSDGVTTALQMHGGSGDCAAYYKMFAAMPHVVNYGVSTAVMRIRNATNSLSERKRKVEQCLEEGALGVSHSIEYQPTPYEEVLVYARLAKKYERPFFLHLRYSSLNKELDGVDEAIRIAKESGARVHISHLHSTGGTFQMAGALDKIRNANAQGLVITCCVYPYSYWATYLNSRRFDSGWQQRYKLTYSDLRLVGTSERLTAQSFSKYREMKKLVAVPEGTIPLETTVDLALKEPFCLIGSDGGIEQEAHANSHPRGAGCFTTALRRGIKLGIELEILLEKMTLLPRNLMLPALQDRGLLANGAWADLTVLDPVNVDGTATVENPNQFSKGIDLVFVNGKLAIEKGKLTATSGVGIHY